MRTYNVTVTHPTNYHQGTHTLTVRDSGEAKTCVYVSGSKFGCGADYSCMQYNARKREYVRLPVRKGDEAAIRHFLACHACTVTAIKPAK